MADQKLKYFGTSFSNGNISINRIYHHIICTQYGAMFPSTKVGQPQNSHTTPLNPEPALAIPTALGPNLSPVAFRYTGSSVEIKSYWCKRLLSSTLCCPHKTHIASRIDLAPVSFSWIGLISPCCLAIIQGRVEIPSYCHLLGVGIARAGSGVV